MSTGTAIAIAAAVLAVAVVGAALIFTSQQPEPATVKPERSLGGEIGAVVGGIVDLAI